jgi:hypothetical protein
MIRIELKKILNIIADKADNNTRNGIVDLIVIRESGLQESEARRYIKELEELNMITVEELNMITVEHKVKGTDIEGKPYRLINLRMEGLEELRDKDEK